VGAAAAYDARVRDSISERLVAGIAGQDDAAIAACFAEDAEFRALIPPGLRERSGAAQAAGLISAWFGDSTKLELLEAQTIEIEDKVRISYRFAGVEEGQP
jgi:hypothetical protein